MGSYSYSIHLEHQEVSELQRTQGITLVKRILTHIRHEIPTNFSKVPFRN